MSAFARQRESDAVRSVEAEQGGGLLARLVARRVEAKADATCLAACLEELERGVANDGLSRAASGTGVGSARTARGPLVYWVHAAPGRVEDVRVVAPTDWTFHPRGVLHEALLGSEACSTLERDAGWLILALDPCVPWTVEVRDA